MHHRVTPDELQDTTIDVHSHCGISMKAYAASEYPFCQSVESLSYRMKSCGVDRAVTFPFSSDLFFDVRRLVDDGRAVAAERPFSEAPYAGENRRLLAEIYDLCPELSDRFLPFVMADPGRLVGEQVAVLEELAECYPIYGLKIAPVQCQSKVTELLGGGRKLLEFAERHDLPVLFHVTTHPEESYSQARDTFEVIRRFPQLRYCLAHCIGFDRSFLELAAGTDRVWVDTSALEIQVRATFENQPFMAARADRFEWDYSDHVSIMRSIVERYPDTIIWGTDSPYYTYISRRMQSEGEYFEFRLKGSYEGEKAALDGLPRDLARRAGCTNAVEFLFGRR